jgi:hypothetical protein
VERSDKRVWADGWAPRTGARDAADFMAGIVSLIAYIKADPSLADGQGVMWTFDFYLDASDDPLKRKARADRIAEGWEATTGWRNGYYFASRDLFGMEDATLEIQFSPPIMAADLDADAA